MNGMATTIRNHTQAHNEPGPDPATLALAALGWILQDEDRAQRLLSLTGLDPDTLRSSLGDKQVQASVLEFLGNHEPDLLRCAEALAVTPEELVAAGRELSR